MKLAELKASALDALNEAHSAAQIIEWASGGRFNDPEGYLLTLEHRSLEYKVGRWSGWQGPYWLHECRTGIVFYGSLAYIKETVKVCSESYFACCSGNGEGTE